MRALPDNGLGYGVLRYLNAQTGLELAGLAAPQIGFNYLGRFAAAAAADWGAAPEAVGLGGGGDAFRLRMLLEINAVTLDALGGSPAHGELVAGRLRWCRRLRFAIWRSAGSRCWRR